MNQVPRTVRILHQETLLDDFFRIDAATLQYERFDGSLSEPVGRLRLDRGDSVAALVVHTGTGCALMVQQFKYPVFGVADGWIVEVVAGMVDRGETPEAAIRREVREEIGYELTHLERVKMEIAGFHDRSVSGAIRYYGARKDAAGNVVEDLIAKALTEALHGSPDVAPGRVVWTSSGELAKTHKVRGILHAAAVQGQPTSGYRQIENIGQCVTSALEYLDEKNETEQPPFQTIIFLLLGAGQGQANREATAQALLVAALDHLEAHPTCAITTVYFLAYTDAEQAAWDEVLRVCSKRLTRV